MVKDPWSKISIHANLHLKKFASTIYHLLIEKKIKVDLVVGAGNSGVVLTRLTKIILNHYGLNIPFLNIPVYRYKPHKTGEDRYEGNEEVKFDNNVLLPLVKRELKNLKNIKTVLFVDDEISEGNSAKAVLKLLIKSLSNNRINYLIVAEDQGFKIQKNEFPNIRVKFYPYAREIEGLSNVISYNVPYEIKQEILKHLSEGKLMARKHMNILLSEPLKEFNKKNPSYTHEFEGVLKKEIPNFSEIQDQYINYLKNILFEGIKEYQNGKIKPYFL